MTPKQTNLTPRLTPSLLTDHMTLDGFSKRPLSMKGQRWKHIVVEEKRRKKKVWLFFRKWRLFIGDEGLKNVWEAIIIVKKRVNHHPKTFEKRFVCGTYHRPKLLVQSRLYNPDYTWIPDYIFRKHTIMAWTKGKLETFCMVSVGSDFRIRIASALDSFVWPTLHRQFLWSTTPRYLYK